uniref:Exo-alpha-sialidase n=1 Tax=candidate division WOR-3 bacterium TaxID=2052148 RepID=A0A7C4GHG1_UNCW3
MKPRKFVVLIFAAGLAATAAAWTPPERVDRRPDNYVTYGNDIAVGPDGTPHIVWSECPRETYLEMVKYSRRDHDTWTVPINISRDSGDLRQPAVVVDSAGRPLAVWSEVYAARIRYARFLGDSWSVPKLCFSTGGITPRLAIDSRDRTHLLFEKYGRPGVIWYSYYVSEADSWAHPCTAAAGPGELGWSDLAVDRDDHLHAVWMDWWTYGIGYSRNDGTGWSEPVRLPDPAPQGQSCDPRIACDALGRPHVVWEERWGGYWVYYSTLVGDTWTQPVRVDTLPGLRPVLCCDETSRLHVVWRRSGLWHRARAGSGWTEPVFISDTAIAMLPELATSPAGLHLAFRGGWWLFYSADAGAGGISEERAIPAGQRLDVVCLRGGELLLRFDVQERCNAAVSLWDSAGRLAWSCSLGQLEPGHHEGRVSVRQLPSGIYVCRLEAGGRPSAAKTVVLK